MGECIFLGVLAVLSGVYYVQTLGYEAVIGDASGGAGFFPRLVCIGLILLALIRFFQIVKKKEWGHFKMMEMFQGMMGMFTISTLLLVVSMPYLGFVVSGFLYLTVVCGILRKAKTGEPEVKLQFLLREAVFLCLLFGIYSFFTKILFVALPAGILTFL